jgi:hypothetical protein
MYPLLGITNSAPFKPTNTYLEFLERGLTTESTNLIVAYDRAHKDNNPESFSSFEGKYLFSNRFFSDFEENYDNILYFFDLSRINADYKKIVDGRYTTLSEPLKRLIDRYHTSHMGPNAHIRRWLFPNDQAYDFYAKQYNVEPELLKKGVELCSKPDIEQETFRIKISSENLV